MGALGKGAKGAAQVVVSEQAMFEHRRKQEILLRTRLEDLMKEEEVIARRHEKSIENRWVQFLRDQKTDELLDSIKVVQHTFEKTLDRKNAVISMLAVDMGEAEEQYRLALRTHLSNIDSLVDLNNRRMTDLDNQFERDLLELKEDFDMERAEIKRKHDLEKADLKLILSNMQKEAEVEDRKLQEETSESHETAIEKMEEELKQMKAELSKINEILRKDIKERFEDFVSNATVNMKDYIADTERDDKFAEKIAGQMRKIKKLDESINTWRSNLNNNIRECEERNNSLRAEKETISQHFKDLKAKMQLWRKGEEKRLAELVSNARNTKSALEHRSEEAEKILRTAELCCQLETEREKVLGFDADVSTEEVSKQVNDFLSKREMMVAEAGAGAEGGGVAPEGILSMNDLFQGSATDGLTDTEFTSNSSDEWKRLEKFWVKYNKVVLDNAAISQEHYHLEHENAKLRQLLKQYLDGISVNQEVMGQGNNLLQTGKFRGGLTGNQIQSKAQSRSNIPIADGNKLISEMVRQHAY